MGLKVNGASMHGLGPWPLIYIDPFEHDSEVDQNKVFKGGRVLRKKKEKNLFY